MKNPNKYFFFCAISFLFGSLTSYVLSSYKYFEIKRELDIPNLIISSISLLIGLFIATTLQEKFNKTQNKHTYVINKFNNIWERFNNIAETFQENSFIGIDTIKTLITKIIQPTSSLRRIFEAFDIKIDTIKMLEKELEDFEIYVSDIKEKKDNIIDVSKHQNEIQQRIMKIEIKFTELLKDIQK